MEANFRQLMEIEQLRSMTSMKELQMIQREAAELRQQISALNEHRKQSHMVDEGLLQMRAIRGDLLWQTWLDRTQADLTAELAKTLSKRERILVRAKKDIGRREAAQDLATQLLSEKAAHRSSSEQDALLDLSVLKSVSDRSPSQ